MVVSLDSTVPITHTTTMLYSVQTVLYSIQHIHKHKLIALQIPRRIIKTKFYLLYLDIISYYTLRKSYINFSTFLIFLQVIYSLHN